MATPIPNGGLGPLGDFNPAADSARPPRQAKPAFPIDGYRPGAGLDGLLMRQGTRTSSPEVKVERPAERPQSDFSLGDPAQPAPRKPEPKPLPDFDDTLTKWSEDFNWGGGDFKSSPPAELPAEKPGKGKSVEEILQQALEKLGKPPAPKPTDKPKPERSWKDILAQVPGSAEKPAPAPRPDDIHSKWDWGHVDTKLPKTDELFTAEMLSKLALGHDMFGKVRPQGRFEGSWDDYKARLKQHNKDIERREQEEYAREAARGGGMMGVGMVALRMHSSYGRGPAMQAPPIVPQDEALTVWKNRHKDSLGELLTPPIGEIAPEVKRVQNKIEEMVEQLAGDELRAKGIKVNINLFSGDTLNAFAARNSDEWDVPGGSRVSEDNARYNSAVASLRPILDPEGSGKPIYELGVTAGALRKLETEDELAFLLGHELGHLLEGHTEKVNRSWLSSQSHEAVADHEAFRMMVKAGYDPAQGLRLLNRLHEGHEPPDMPSLLEGLSAGTSSHHHEGVRVAMGQLKLEQLRRTDVKAQPTGVRREMPEWMKLQAEANLDFDPNKKLHNATLALATEFMTLEWAYLGGGEIGPKKSEASQDMFRAPWETATAGRAFKEALAVIDQAEGSAQKKGDAALLLYQSLAGDGWKRGGPPDLKEVAAEVGAFFQRQTDAGWSADAFLKTMAELSKGLRVDSQFAHKVLLSPGFQEAGAQLYESNPEFQMLFDAAPRLLATSSSSSNEISSFSLRGLTQAMRVLSGERPKADSYLDDNSWPKDLPAGQGRLDDVHRENVLSYLREHASTKEWAKANVLKGLKGSQEKSQRAEFTSQIHDAIEPIRRQVAEKQVEDLKTDFVKPNVAAALFQSAASHALSEEQAEGLKQNFLQLLAGPTPPEHIQFESFEVFGQMLADILNNPETKPADKERVADYMMRNLSPRGLGPDNGEAPKLALQRFLSAQDPAQLLGKVQAEASGGLGLTPPPPRQDSFASLLGSGPQRVNPNPLTSSIGFNRTLSPKVAAGVDSAQWTRWSSEYDFWRMGQFLDLFTKDGDNQSKYGFLRGLTEVIRDSVSLEFNRGAAFHMQQSVEKFYERKVNGWTVKTVKAHGLHGQAIVMEEAKGRTARRVLGDKPEVYQSAMKAMAQVEQDALLGIATEKNPAPQALHANPDFHDGQVLIDEETKTVTILDFGQAVPIDNRQREYAVDLMTIIAKGYSPEDAARLLQARTGVPIDQAELDKILASPDQMDVFTKLLGTMAQQGAKIPIEVVHWVLGMNRQRSLGEKLDAPIDGKLRRLGMVRMTGGSLEAYNAIRIAGRSPLQALRGGILGPIGAWVERVLSEQNLLDMMKGKVKAQTLGS
jgi:hypothetical protein